MVGPPHKRILHYWGDHATKDFKKQLKKRRIEDVHWHGIFPAQGIKKAELLAMFDAVDFYNLDVIRASYGNSIKTHPEYLAIQRSHYTRPQLIYILTLMTEYFRLSRCDATQQLDFHHRGLQKALEEEILSPCFPPKHRDMRACHIEEWIRERFPSLEKHQRYLRFG